MDSKLLIVKIITLLYKESFLKDSVSSKDLAKEALSLVKIPDGSGEFNTGRDILIALKTTASHMLEEDRQEPYDSDTFLQRIQINCLDDTYLLEAFKAGLLPTEDTERLKAQCIHLRHDLVNATREEELKKLIKDAYKELHFDYAGTNIKKFASDLAEKLSPYTGGLSDQQVEGIINEIDIQDTAHIETYLRQSLIETSNEGIMRLGHQAINRMTGDHNGLRRGETVLVGALQHNYKTGLMLTWFAQLAIYNQPFMRDPSKKPLILFISTENDTHMNIMWLYRHLYENSTGRALDKSSIDLAEASRFVHARLSSNGYNVKMLRADPSVFTFQLLAEKVLKFESEGYEIHVCLVDYLNMFNKRGLTSGPNGYESRDLWRRCRNLFSVRGTIFISPHQLSPDAKRLTRMDVEDFVKTIANKGYYDGCTTIDQEVDLEIAIHIVKVNGRSYLTIQRGKHRATHITPERHLYTVLPFKEIGNIPDDLNGADISMRHPGADALGDTDQENPWFKL